MSRSTGESRPPPAVVSGIPVSPKIAEVAGTDRYETRRSLGLPHHRDRGTRVVLATLASENLADRKLAFSRVVKWAGDNPDHFVVLIAGRLAKGRLERDAPGRKKLAKNGNEGLDEAAREMARDLPNMQVVGYTSRMAEYMHASDVIVSKPAGLTVAESLAFGLAWVIVKPWLLDVERPNAAFLREMDIARLVEHVSKLDSALEDVIRGGGEGTSSTWLEKAQASAMNLAHPEAAMTVVRSAESVLAS